MGQPYESLSRQLSALWPLLQLKTGATGSPTLPGCASPRLIGTVCGLWDLEFGLGRRDDEPAWPASIPRHHTLADHPGCRPSLHTLGEEYVM